MIYRNSNFLFHPVERKNDDGDNVVIGYRQEICKSINAAKRRSRELGDFKSIRRGPAPLPLVG